MRVHFWVVRAVWRNVVMDGALSKAPRACGLEGTRPENPGKAQGDRARIHGRRSDLAKGILLLLLLLILPCCSRLLVLPLRGRQERGRIKRVARVTHLSRRSAKGSAAPDGGREAQR